MGWDILLAGRAYNMSYVDGRSGSRRMRACRLRSLVFALGGSMINVMVTPIVVLPRERYRAKHNRRRD